MTSVEFCYWLQGYFELQTEQSSLTKGQTELIQRHLSLVFKHDIDPKAGSAAVQAALQEIHDGKPGVNAHGQTLYRC